MASKRSRLPGTSLIEVVLGFGIMALALFALLGVCSMALRSNRQSVTNVNAVQVADAQLHRAVSSVLNDTPAGTRDTFWASTYTYPANPYKKGTVTVGRDEFHFTIYAADVPGLGTAPDNLVRKVDTYVWWAEPGQPGSHLTSSTRLVNKGEMP